MFARAEEEFKEQLEKLAKEKYSKLGRQQLRIQGHYASGALDKSFEEEVKGTLNGIITAEISFNDYGLALETGIPANRVRYPINALIPWARIIMPNKSIEELRSFLWATRKTQQTEGIGTIASKRFSQNRKRTGWLSDTIETVGEIDDYLNPEKALNIILEEVAKKYNNN